MSDLQAIGILDIAAGLLEGTPDDVHPEYERAVVEMSTQVLGAPMSDAQLIAYIIGARHKKYHY